MTNEQRANNAEQAIFTIYSDDPINGVVDLLADLMHYADREGIDFETALKTARHHHETELNEATA